MSDTKLALKARKHLRSVYPEFSDVFDIVKTIYLNPQDNIEPFQALSRSIIYQQLSGKAAATIHARWIDLFNTKKYPKPEDVLKMSSEQMRSAGVSVNKQKAFIDLSKRTLEGLVPTRKEAEALDSETLIQRISQVHGIGEWTVQMMLLFYFGRADIWPTKDLGVQNGHRILMNKRKNLTPIQLEKWGTPLAPFRSYAALYLWKISDLKKL